VSVEMEQRVESSAWTRRRLGLAAAGITTALLGLPWRDEATAKKKKQKRRQKAKYKTVTRTFANTNQIAIPGVGTQGPAYRFPSIINVRGFDQGKITDVNLTLHGIKHGFFSDVDVLLVAPDGRNALVISDIGDDSAQPIGDLTFTLDDEAGSPLPLLLVSGTFQPTNNTDVSGSDAFPAPSPAPSGNVALATFNGSNPNGQWELFVNDDFSGDTGAILGGWELEITAKVKHKKKKRR
jgi:subtilisin-like proprotein convertase family protein